MTWRVGKQVSLNVYEGDRPVCQCHTAEDAMRIVEAMNAAEQVLPATEVQVCTRLLPHICRVNGPCNGWPRTKCKHKNHKAHPVELPDIRMCPDCDMLSFDRGITWMPPIVGKR